MQSNKRRGMAFLQEGMELARSTLEAGIESLQGWPWRARRQVVLAGPLRGDCCAARRAALAARPGPPLLSGAGDRGDIDRGVANRSASQKAALPKSPWECWIVNFGC